MIAPFKIHRETIENLPDLTEDYIFERADVEDDIGSELESIIKPRNGIINGDELQRKWFSTSDHYDVFISHSHQDRDVAERLAAYLSVHCGFRCFIDTDVWLSADQLHSDLDDIYSQMPDGNINYRKSQLISSHVHSMLTMAILDTIYQSDFFIFIESGYSLNLRAVTKDDETFSPWLYDEINIANKISRTRVGEMLFSDGSQPLNESQFSMVRTVNTDGYKILTQQAMEAMEHNRGDKDASRLQLINMYKVPRFRQRQY